MHLKADTWDPDGEKGEDLDEDYRDPAEHVGENDDEHALVHAVHPACQVLLSFPPLRTVHSSHDGVCFAEAVQDDDVAGHDEQHAQHVDADEDKDGVLPAACERVVNVEWQAHAVATVEGAEVGRKEDGHGSQKSAC